MRLAQIIPMKFGKENEHINSTNMFQPELCMAIDNLAVLFVN